MPRDPPDKPPDPNSDPSLPKVPQKTRQLADRIARYNSGTGYQSTKPMPIANFHLSKDYLLESYHLIDQYAYMRTRLLKPPAVFKICAILMLLNAIFTKFKSTWTTLQSLTGHVRLIKKASPYIIKRTPATKQNKSQLPKCHHNDHASTNTYPNEAKMNGDLILTNTLRSLPNNPKHHQPNNGNTSLTNGTHLPTKYFPSPP
jgi:hypothetical protein